MSVRQLSESDARWTVREVVNPDTGRVERTYYFKRQKAHRLLLNSSLARQYGGYSLIEKDLRNVSLWFGEIVRAFEETREVWEKIQGHQASPDRERFRILKGMFVASVTSYGKCFARCEGRRVKLERRQVPERFLDTHDSLIEFRNNFAAHSGAAKIEIGQVVLTLDPKPRRRTAPHFATEISQPDTLALDDTKVALELVETLRDFVLERVRNIGERLNEEVVAKGPEYWYKQVK